MKSCIQDYSYSNHLTFQPLISDSMGCAHADLEFVHADCSRHSSKSAKGMRDADSSWHSIKSSRSLHGLQDCSALKDCSAHRCLFALHTDILSTLNDVIQTLNAHQHLAQTLSEWAFVESQQHEPSEQREHGLEGVQHLLGNIV